MYIQSSDKIGKSFFTVQPPNELKPPTPPQELVQRKEIEAA
jgi:hypothetical protein